MAEPQTRILRCDTCKTLEPLPDFEGSGTDHLLERLLRDHKFPDGSEHFGKLMRVETRHWDSPSTREAIIARVREESGHTGLDPEFYTLKMTFEQDAMVCFNRHHRNPLCNDYKTDGKILTPNTRAERKEAGLQKYNKLAHARYLCEFCPVHTLVTTEARHRAGLYT